MRRLLLALATTAAGLAAVLSYKTTGSAADTAAATPATGTQGASAGTASGSAASTAGGSTSSTSSKSSTTGSSGKTGSAGSADSAAAQTLTGAVENTAYGPMQVQVTVLDRKVTGVKVLQQTDDGTMSQQIDANAIPQLNRETLAAQSARIDAVSGASYTSMGYIQSLQSALDKLAG